MTANRGPVAQRGSTLRGRQPHQRVATPPVERHRACRTSRVREAVTTPCPRAARRGDSVPAKADRRLKFPANRRP